MDLEELDKPYGEEPTLYPGPTLYFGVGNSGPKPSARYGAPDLCIGASNGGHNQGVSVQMCVR